MKVNTSTRLSIKIRKDCRLCYSTKLKNVLSLGDLYVSDFVHSSKEGFKAPLDLVICETCSLVQLKHTAINPEKLYRTYWYKSGMNKTMVNALIDIAVKVENSISFNKEDIVLDIGANDGTLLRAYSNRHLVRVGFEPARNLIPEAEVDTDKIINNFFNYKDFNKLFPNKKAVAITSIAMFYDLEEPNEFVADIAKTLSQHGVWIIQMAYLPLMLEQNAFDNLCHEHIEYYSLLSLENLLKRHKLEVYDVELNDVNGGSFRVYVKHKSDKNIIPFPHANLRLSELRKEEKQMGLHTMNPYCEFEKRVLDLKEKCVSFIKESVRKNKTISIYGASTKGNTLLQFYGLTNKHIKSAAERNPDKWGLKTVGSGIPIVSEVEVRAQKPDYMLMLPWHFLKEFIDREQEYLKSGGHFIIPLPEFKII